MEDAVSAKANGRATKNKKDAAEPTATPGFQEAIDASAAKDKAANAPKPRKFSQALFCKMSESVRAERGLELAKVTGELEELDAEQKLVNGGFRARRKPLKEKSKELSHAVREGGEHVDVECEEHIVYATNSAFVIRRDTSEVVPGSERPLRASEMQATLPLVDPDADGGIVEDDYGKPKAKPDAKKPVGIGDPGDDGEE